MNAIAIATLVTSLLAFGSTIQPLSKGEGSTWWQRVLALGGAFGITWSISYLLGA